MADTDVINKWVTEFFIRRKKNPRVSPTNLLSALKLGDSSSADDSSNLKLKKASLLREISDSLIRGNVDEGTLDLLETLEKLLQEEEVLLTESHKSAYCLTAVECTVKFMWPLSVSEGLYGDAVERIWTKRIGVLKGSRSGLVSEELLKWEVDLRMAVEDADVYKRIRESNVRYSAVCVLNQFLEEQWGMLGSSSLESVAQRQLQEPNTPQPSRVNSRTGGTSGQRQDDDDASEKSSGRVRPRLPTPVPLNVSPLNKKRKASPLPRKKKKFWTPEEVEALRQGVREHGKSWKYIKNSNPVVFADRTQVDLKDKWRNMLG